METMETMDFEQPARKRGAPSKYDPALADEICERLAAGESLVSICDSDDRFPAETSVRRWAINDIDGFASKYAHAREMGMDALAERSLKVAEDGSRDYTLDADGQPVFVTEHVQRSRLICDQIKWFASKMAPRKYGDKQSIELTGKDGAPIASTTVIALAQSMSPEQLIAARERLQIAASPVIEAEVAADDI